MKDSAKAFVLILGPCSLENETITFTTAQVVAELRDKYPQVRVFFKGSFDKANRTSIHSDRGTGESAGLNLLQKVKQQFGLPVTTDIHLPDQAERVSQVADILQIPAFLCRQTDILCAASKTGRTVNVKKGQFLSPYEMEFVIQKLRESNASEILATERGSTFGYQNLVVDMRSFKIMGGFGVQTIFDATHSVQLPGAGGGKTSGKREFVPPLSMAAMAAGAKGLFLEIHPDPDNAVSDGPNQIPLHLAPELVERCLEIHSAVNARAKLL